MRNGNRSYPTATKEEPLNIENVQHRERSPMEVDGSHAPPLATGNGVGLEAPRSSHRGWRKGMEGSDRAPPRERPRG